MLLVENLGESIYNALASKSLDKNKISIYKKLSLNESETANKIGKELKNLGFLTPKTRRVLLKIAAYTIFTLLSHDKLETLLKKALKKRKFRIWFNRYHENNESFWQSMIDHEVLQYELLKL